MPAALTIAGKDLRQRLRDRSAVLLAVVVPLALSAIFAALFGPASTPRPFHFAVVDTAGGPIAASFTDEVLRPMQSQGIVTVRRMTDPAAVRRAVRSGDLDAAFVFPAGFSRTVQSAAPVHLEVIGNVDSPTGTSVARSVARSWTSGLDGARVAVATVAHGHPGVPPGRLAALAREVAGSPPPIALRDRATTARVLDAKTYLAAGMAIFFLMFTVQFGVSSLIAERADGTMARLLAAPIRASSILLGKLVTSVVLGLSSVTVLVVASTYLLGAHWGDPLGVAMVVVAAVLAATGITALVASLARTTEQAGSWQAVVAVSLGLLGGSFFPVQQTGSVMATLSLLTPHAWFLRGLGSLAGDGGPSDTLPAVAALLAIAGVTGGLAATRIRRTVAP